jgi:multimeric flavodoxin WrbA
MGIAGVAVAAGALGATASAQEASPKRKIIGINGSPRKGKTTSAALKVCLDAAREQDPELETELIELADFSIPAQLAAGLPLKDGETDDFPKLGEKLGDPAVSGFVIGSPVYFNNMSALCKAFLDRSAAFRSDGFKLRDKVAGVLAVGSSRNGGQELTVHSIQAALTGQDMVIVGSGKPSGRVGATLWNQDDSIDQDAFGIETAKKLGRRVAEVAKKLS